MITALLALGLHLTVVPPPEGAFLQSAPMAVGGERPSWRIARRMLRRDKKGTESRATWMAVAATTVSRPTPPECSLYSIPLLAPPRPASTPTGKRDPPASSTLL